MDKLSGKWNVVVHTYMGDQRSEHELLAEGNTLTGLIVDKGNGNKAEIQEGKIDGNKFSYKFTIKIPVGELEFFMEGELKEDGSISGNSSNAMGAFEFEGQKAI